MFRTTQYSRSSKLSIQQRMEMKQWFGGTSNLMATISTSFPGKE
jgi:hypothetical protein